MSLRLPGLWFLLPGMLFAAPASAAIDDEASQPAIVVTAAPHSYHIDSTSTATRTPTSLIDLPQSIALFGRERIADQAILSLGDALRYVPGVTVAQGEGNRDQQVIRGVNSSADLFVDGLRDDVQYFRDVYNLERIEVLKGPNALAFGRGGGGGIINRVTKLPEARGFLGVEASADSHGGVRAAADLNQPMATGVAVRLNAVAEDGGSFRDAYYLHRAAINPVLGLTLSDKAGIDIGYEHIDDRRVADRGLPSQSGLPLAGYRDTFFGVPGVNRTTLNADIATLRAYSQFGDTLTLNGRLLYGDYAKAYTNVLPASPVVAGRFDASAYTDATHRKNLLGQVELVWTGRTGGIGHTLLAGIDAGTQATQNDRLNGFFGNALFTSVALTDPLMIPAPVFRSGTGERHRHSNADSLGVYVQDQLAFGEHVQLLLGLRRDRFHLDYVDQLTGQALARTDNLWSPRAGLIIKPRPNIALYANYSRSYLPQSGDQFASLTVTTAALEPERFDSYEAGAKWDITPRLALTAAVFRLDRRNSQANGPVPGTIVLTGASRDDGVELSADGRIQPDWQISAGASWQDAKVTATTTAAAADARRPLVPRFQASLWNRYDITPGFGVGVGLLHQASSYATVGNAVRLPGYTRVDTALYLKLTKALTAQLNIENLFNTGYFATADNDNNLTPGGPRAARLTLRARF